MLITKFFYQNDCPDARAKRKHFVELTKSEFLIQFNQILERA